MHLSSIFKEYGIDIKRTKIVRHPLSKEDIREVHKCGMLADYQASQVIHWFDNCSYVASFVGTTKTEAKFFGLYEITGTIDGADVRKKMPKDYPFPDHFDASHRYYVMKKMDVMSELIDRLYIEWGKGTQAWCQRAENDKAVLSIASREEIPFPGYEALILNYSQLSDIVYGDVRYQKWREALSNVNGIYLICDTKHHKQYVGSTYNNDGILKRWDEYVKTCDGGDVKIKEHLKKHPKAYQDFQFTILKLLPNPVTQKEAVDAETLYKKKLCTYNEEYGLNLN